MCLPSWIAQPNAEAFISKGVSGRLQYDINDQRRRCEAFDPDRIRVRWFHTDGGTIDDTVISICISDAWRLPDAFSNRVEAGNESL